MRLDSQDKTSITGIRLPIDCCARIMLQTTKKYLENPTSLKEVVFCLYGNEAYSVFEKALNKII